MDDRHWITVERDSTGTAVIQVKERHLQDFKLFIRRVVAEKIGMEDGVFKIKIVENVQPTSKIADLLQFVKQNISQSSVKKQLLYHGHGTDHIYGVLSATETEKKQKERLLAFKKHLVPASFNKTSACCSKALEGSTELLEHHFWSTIRRASEPSNAFEFIAHDDVERLVMEAGPLRVKYGVPDRTEEFTYMKTTADDATKEKESKKPNIVYCPGLDLNSVEFKVTPNFSLSKLETVLDVYPDSLPGVTSPFLYVSAPHALFGYHTEDSVLFSINYLHFGAPCVWYFVAPQDFKKFLDIVRFLSLDPNEVACSNILGSEHKFLLLHRDILRKFKINAHMVIQYERELVVTYPFAAHMGFKMGFNIQQAVNFADVELWPEPALLATKCECNPDGIIMDLKELLSVCRPNLVSKYIKHDFGGLMEAISDNEFVRRLGMLPSTSNVSQCAPVPEDSQLQNLAVEMEVEYNNEDLCEDHESLEELNDFKGGRCILKCPNPGCSTTFKGGRSKLPRLRNHMKSNHGSSQKELKDLDILYPAKKQFRTKRVVCDVCGELKAGGPFALTVHKRKCHA